jgi:hypothetical protein
MDQVEYRPTAGNADYRVGDDGSIWTGKRGGWRRMKPTLKDGYHQVRRLHAEGMTCPGIALRWGLDRGTAHRIVTGRTWKHLPATSG